MNILTLCTYPIENAAHGGQLRARNIVDAYRSAGHSVQIAGVLGSEHYGPEDGFLPYPGSALLSHVIDPPFLMEDYAIGQLYAKDHEHYGQLTRTIRRAPDLIHVEQPWLFAFASRFRSQNCPRARLIYGSQNVESRLKYDIVQSYQGSAIAGHRASLVGAVEIDAARGADAVVCVSKNDASWLETRTNRKIVLAPNGVRAWKSTADGRRAAEKITSGQKYALYCASAHPPNMTGFFDIFGGGFGSLRPDEILVIAGGAGVAISEDARLHNSAKLAEKIVAPGMVSQPCLEGLLDGAHCIVLPLTQGGGTNLKTAEALWAGKHIVATSVAMRGFEPFLNSRGVHVIDAPSRFKQLLRQVMSSDPLQLTPAEMELRSSVVWEKCLRALPELAKALTV